MEFESNCPICNRIRLYKVERNRDLGLQKPCRSCAQCHNCNTGLGHFKDNIRILQSTIKYINNGNK